MRVRSAVSVMPSVYRTACLKGVSEDVPETVRNRPVGTHGSQERGSGRRAATRGTSLGYPLFFRSGAQDSRPGVAGSRQVQERGQAKRRGSRGYRPQRGKKSKNRLPDDKRASSRLPDS